MCKKFAITLFMYAIIFSLVGNLDAQFVEKWNIEHNLDLSSYTVAQNKTPFSGEMEGDFDGDSVNSIVSYTVDKNEIIVEVRNGLTGEIEFNIDLVSKYGSEVKGAFIGDVDNDGRDELVFHYKANSVVYEYKGPLNNTPSIIQNLAHETQLAQNYPNPFNPVTHIEYSLAKPSKIQIIIFNQLGQRVRTLVDNNFAPAGTYSIMWDGKNENSTQVPSGIYYYQIRTDDLVLTRKSILLK
jgi:hypothetical protein